MHIQTYRDRAQKIKALKIAENPNCGECGGTIDHSKLRACDIHHIDKDVTNNDPVNLIVLCRKCHKKHHPRGPNKKPWKRRDKLTKWEKVCGLKTTEIAFLMGVSRQRVYQLMQAGSPRLDNIIMGE